jgi:hypothetical protein
MQVQGHIQNGLAVPDGSIALPEGAKVTIVVSEGAASPADVMTAEELAHYRRALVEIDTVPNENPGDSFRGADHDQVLYGRGK